MIKLLLGALAIAGVSAPNASQDQFDLICTGTLTHQVSLSKLADELPWTGRLRVDLKSGLFCPDECKVAERIAKIEPDSIVFKEWPKHVINYQIDASKINRLTGYYSRNHSKYRSKNNPIEFMDRYSAKCKSTEFTGFPKTLF
jgi:hypothetical protein